MKYKIIILLLGVVLVSGCTQYYGSNEEIFNLEFSGDVRDLDYCNIYFGSQEENVGFPFLGFDSDYECKNIKEKCESTLNCDWSIHVSSRCRGERCTPQWSGTCICRNKGYDYYSDWECVKWINKTVINSKYIENCCVDLDMALTDDNKEKQLNGSVDDINLTYSFSVEGDNLAYFGGVMCFEFNETDSAYNGLQIGDYKVDVNKCNSTPKMIETDEMICVMQKRKGGS